MATSALQATFALYLAILLRRRGRVPYGCLDEHSTAAASSVARGLLLALAGVPAATGAALPPFLAHRAILLAGAALAVLIVVVAAQTMDLLAASRPKASR